MTSSANQLVEHLFRHESARLVAVLTRAFGIRRLELVEDMVQAALLEAMHAWRHGNVPDNPAGWIHQAAKNRILDALRREQTWQKAVAMSGQSADAQESLIDEWLDDELLPDSLLRMMFVCCHPLLDRQSQIALTLKTLCGFGISEIASGLLRGNEAVRKQIQRARKTLADAGVPIELPSPAEVNQRLDAVHDVLYLLFNEGYSTSRGSDPIRDDLCEEAARLCHLLCQSSVATAATKALLSLMLFQAARLPSRTRVDGAAILLEDQDRSQWDVRLMAAATHWLDDSKTSQPTVFHLEAGIARQHSIASSVETTDWNRIVALYDRLLLHNDSPVYRLNRAIAVGQAGDRALALQELCSLQDRPELQNYPYLNCAMAHLHELDGNDQRAMACYQAALTTTDVPHEQRLLERRISRLSGS